MTGAPLSHLRWDAAAATDKPPVLLLHGIGGGRTGWSEVGPALAQAGGCSVFALDLPGYGESAAIEPFDLAGLADAVERFIVHVGAANAVLVGHSMGGMVAQELAARAPARVAGLVLASTSPAFGKADGDWQRAFVAARFAPLDDGLGMAGLAAQLVPAMLGSDTAPHRAAAAQALMAGVPEATYRAAVLALLRFDRRAALPAITAPTLVITGEHDRTAPPEVARRMAEKIPAAGLAIVPGAGHLLPIENPAAFAAAVAPLLHNR